MTFTQDVLSALGARLSHEEMSCALKAAFSRFGGELGTDPLQQIIVRPCTSVQHVSDAVKLL